MEFYGDLVCKLREKKLFVGLIFLISSETLSCVTNVLDIILMQCDSLHVWLLTQSWLIALLPSLITHRSAVHQTQ